MKIRASRLLLTTLFALALLTLAVVTGFTPLTRLDHRLGAAAVGATAHVAPMRRVWAIVAVIEHPAVSRSLLTVVAVTLLLHGRRVLAAQVAATLVLSTSGSTVMKLLVARPRPSWPSPVSTAAGYSFPSGHATAGWACAAASILVLRQLRVPDRRQRVVQALVVSAAVVVSADRVFLGVHYLSDVVAGMLLGWACALAARVLLPSGPRSSGPRSSGS